MAESDRNNKFAGTYRKLFNTIERGAEQCSTDRIQTLLEEKRGQFKLGLDAFSAASSQSRSKLNAPVNINGKSVSFDQKEKDLITRVSDIVNLNEIQCASVWESYKQENKNYVDRFQSAESLPLNENEGLVMDIISFYFEDRICLLNCIGSLQRISINKEHPFNAIASDIINTLSEDNTNSTPFVNRLLTQFSNLVRSKIPTRHCVFPGWPAAYAKQNLKEQKAILEILFIFSITASYSPSFILSLIQEFEVNNFGTFQIFSYALDSEGEKLREQVTNISSLLAVSVVLPPYLTLDIKLDPAGADASLIDTPEMIAKINQVVLYMGNDEEHSVFLMAWSYFLTCLRSAIDAASSELPKEYSVVKPILEGKQQLSTSILSDRSFAQTAGLDASEKRTICIQQTDHLERTLIGRSLKLGVFDFIQGILDCGICDEDDVNSFGYRSVLRLLLKSFLSTTLPQFLPTESYSGLIDCYCAVYQDQPELCTAFWNDDMDKDDQNPLISSALGRFPVFFTDFTRLLSALTCTNELDIRVEEKPADKVYQYLCSIPTITVILKDGFYVSATVENNVAVTHTDQAMRVTPPLNYITGITIPQQTRGILLSSTENNRIVQFTRSYSGWHMLVSILANSMKQRGSNGVDVQNDDFTLDGGNSEAIVSILDLMYHVLINNPKLVPSLVNHVQAAAAVPGVTYNTPILVSVLCDILTFCSNVHPCPISIATLAVKCIHLLLPHYRQHIWAYLQTAPILPRVFSNTIPSSSTSKLSFAANRVSGIRQIVAKFECAAGSYGLLLAFLDLVHGLVRDIQDNWWVRETGAAPDCQAQVDTLYICLHYLMLEVFPSCSVWRYKKISERYLISIKLLSIFIEICSYFKERPAGTQLTLSDIRDGLFNNFLYNGGFYHVSPLLHTVSDGADMANALYKSSHIKEAEQAEELTELTLIFIKTLLQRRLEQINEGTSQPESILERLMFERPVQGSCPDFLLHIAKHINYRHSITLPIQATNVLSLLCRTTSAWKTVPSFVQHLGDTAEAHAIIRAYLEIAKDDSQNEILLSAIWQLITSLLETQPSLAILFLDCGDFIMPSPKSAVRLLNNQSTSTVANTSTNTNTVYSAIRAAVDILDKWETLSINKPAVVSNVLRFLSTFWQTAFDHYDLVERTRSDSALWDVLGKVLLNPKMDVSSKDVLENVNLLEADFSEKNQCDLAVRQLCCANLSKAFAMRIIAYEIHLTAGSKKSSSTEDSLPVGLRNLLSKISEPTKLSQMRVEFVKSDFNPQLSKMSDNTARALLLTIGISDSSSLLFKSPVIGSGDDGAPGEPRQYGYSYLYSFRMTANRVFSLYNSIREKYNLDRKENMLVTPEINAAMDVERLSSSLLKQIIEANYNYSMVDSQIVLLRSFKTFVETCSHHVNSLIWVAKGSTNNLDNLCSFISDLIQQAKAEERRDGVTLTSYSMLIHTIRNLIEDWIEKSKPILEGQDFVAKEKYFAQIFRILFIIRDLLMRENFALMQSVLDTTAVYFHRPLLESILLCLYTLRGATEHVCKQLDIPSCLKVIVSVTCSCFHVLCVKAQSFSAEGSTATEEDMDNCIKDVTIVTSLLQEIVHSRYGINQDFWLSEFATHHTISSLLKLFYGGIEVMVKEVDRQTSCSDRLYSLNITPFTETALYLLLTLSNIPKAAQLLVENHVFDALTNNSLTTRLQQGTLDLFIQFGDKNKREPGYVERNPLHSVWCQILDVVSNLLRTVNDSDTVLRNTVNLLQICGPQIGKAFEKANSPSDSLFALAPLECLSEPLLQELKCINNVFYELSKQLERIPHLATNLFRSFKDCSFLLLQRYLYFFTHPSHMKAQLYRTNQAEATDKFMNTILKSILTITHTMLTTLIILCNADLVLTEPEIEWPFGNTILYPDMRASTDNEASFGTMVECINAGIIMVNQWQDSKDENQPMQEALDVVQSCSLMLTSQAALWVAKPNITNEMKMIIAVENIMDIVEVLSKAASTLEKLSEKNDVDIKSRIKLIYMLQTFLSKRFFEN
ncbi:hypothetical protein G6F43_009807 [Rhizopus delemar]|nr:hypothetical protein G6F43_009807 [Rhizopus delemar]